MMRYVKVTHSGVSKFIADNDVDSLQLVKKSGGVVELDSNGDIRYYYPHELAGGRNVSKATAEEIFGIVPKRTRGKTAKTVSSEGDTPSE